MVTHMQLTPANSTDLAPRRTPKLLPIDTSFNLGPAALGSLSPPANVKGNGSIINLPSPTSPTSPALSRPRRRQSARSTSQSTPSKRKVTLDPPPMARTKIIQMKPKGAKVIQNDEEYVENATKTQAKTQTAGNKRKPGAPLSSTKRKVARKTAHSEIERRRRSKMNDQFDLLKELVPACKNREMHKLSILQASTDYIQYLHESIQKLSSAHEADLSRSASPQPPLMGYFTEPVSANYFENEQCDKNEEEEEEEAEFEDNIDPEIANNSYDSEIGQNYKLCGELDSCSQQQASEALLLLADQSERPKGLSVKDLLS